MKPVHRNTLVVLVLAGLVTPFAIKAYNKHYAKLQQEDAEAEEYNAQPNPSGGIVVSAIMGCDDIPICEKECDAGSSDRCRRLAVSYSTGQGVDRNETTATGLFVKGCEMGNASSCLSAGQMYEYKHGVEKDDARAAGYYRKSCDLGYGAGCVNYGIMLENGRGVPKDLPAARALYDAACTQGAKVACAKRDSMEKDNGGAGTAAPSASAPATP